jgi:Major Facilitator Superfamily.
LDEEGIRAIQITDKESNWQIAKDISSSFIGTLSGDMFAFGMGLMLLDETHLALSFGIDMMITPIVGIFCLIPVGNIVDRYRHKTILNWSISIRLVALVIFAATSDFFNGRGKLFPVILYLIINAISVNFNNAAYTASVHELVNNGKISRLSSLVQGASSLALILSSALGAALYSSTNFTIFIYVEITATGLSFLILQTMHFHYKTLDKQTYTSSQSFKSQMAGFKQGLAYVQGRLLLVGIILVAVVVNFLFTALSIGLPFILKNQLDLGNTIVGYLNSAFSFGMLAASLLMGFFSKNNNLKTKLLVPLLLLGFEFGILGLGLLAPFTVKGVGVLGSLVMFCIGVTITILNITCNVRLQTTVPTKLLGRVSSLLMVANTAVNPLGVLFFTFIFQNSGNGGFVFIINGTVMLFYTMIMTPLVMKGIKNEEKYAEK